GAQGLGTPTPRCSKTVSPPSPEMTAERISHSTVSYGSVPAATKRRATVRPRRAERSGGLGLAPSSRPTGSVAMLNPPLAVPRILRCRASYTTISCAVKDFFQMSTRRPPADRPTRLGDVLRAALGRLPEAERLADHGQVGERLRRHLPEAVARDQRLGARPARQRLRDAEHHAPVEDHAEGAPHGGHDLPLHLAERHQVEVGFEPPGGEQPAELARLLL